MIGWIKLHRKLLNHWIWKNEKYLKGWIWFLLRANHEPNKILMGSELINIDRGQFITSIFKICEATGLTQQNTRTFLKLLERDQMINKQTTSKLTKITILKYDSYQLNQQAEEAETNNQTTNDQQTSNNPVTTDKKEEKEENNKKEKKVSIPPEFQDVVNYCNERNKGVNPQKWFDHYQAKGWLIGKTKMKDWEAAVRTWEKDTNEPISELAQIKKEIKDGTFK